jgi:hypothetical protein
MSGLCIYCGQRPATTKDHVPPKSFFAQPRPDNLITVPCCYQCNAGYGTDDERVRNILTSQDATEDHTAIREQLGGKRNRSWQRNQGKSSFRHVVASLKVVDAYTASGIFLGERLAFDLDQPVIDRFIGRTTRALMYHEYDVGFVEGHVAWRKPPMEMKRPLSAKPKSIGDDVFWYVGYYKPGAAKSLWILNFYGGAEFMAIFRAKRQSSQTASP